MLAATSRAVTFRAAATPAAGGITTARSPPLGHPLAPGPTGVPSRLSKIRVGWKGVYIAPVASPAWPPEYQPATSTSTSAVPAEL